ncbi:hypothetical protein [Spirillospora sp. CA-294931]|uniref:hypothetical protein n=1 Tax=Spirillospora sp. CA-294931 TaxID=3240042 RepID=UPI003D8B9061
MFALPSKFLAAVGLLAVTVAPALTTALLADPASAGAVAAAPATCPQDHFCLFSGPRQSGEILYRGERFDGQNEDFDPPIHPRSYQFRFANHRLAVCAYYLTHSGGQDQYLQRGEGELSGDAVVAAGPVCVDS